MMFGFGCTYWCLYSGDVIEVKVKSEAVFDDDARDDDGMVVLEL